MDKLNKIIQKFKSEARTIEIGSDIFICSNFPNALEQPIKDYIECNYKVTNRDQFGLTFENK